MTIGEATSCGNQSVQSVYTSSEVYLPDIFIVNLQHETFTIRCLYNQMITFVYLLQVAQPLGSERDDRSSSPLLPSSQEGDLVRIFLL